MRNYFQSILIGVLMGTSYSGLAQDPHLSMFDLNRQWLNPSLTGTEKGIGVGLHYRNQWASLLTPFTTYYAMTDARWKELGTDFSLGTGLLFMADEAGSASWSTRQIKWNNAWQYLDEENNYIIRAGLGIGFSQQRIDPAALVFGDQIDDRLLVNPTTVENISGEPLNRGSMDFGVSGAKQFNPSLGLEMGITQFQMLYTSPSWLASPYKMSLRRWSAYMKGEWKASSSWTVQPLVLWMQQGPIDMFSWGARALYKKGEDEFFLGAQRRLYDAWALQTGVSLHNFTIAYNHDIHSGISGASSGLRASSSEVLLAYRLIRTPKSIETPATIEIRQTPEVVLSGQVFSKADSSLYNGKMKVELLLVSEDSSQMVEVLDSLGPGFIFKVIPCLDYRIRASADGYMGTGVHMKIPCDVENNHQISVPDLYLQKIPSNKIFRLNHIYYAFNESGITEEGKRGLDDLYEILMDNPALVIEIGAHTDTVGSIEYNLKLSEDRARNCVNRLIAKGIDPSRLRWKGFGSLVPVEPNSHPDGSDNAPGRARNRRTEFKIIGKLENGEIIYGTD